MENLRVCDLASASDVMVVGAVTVRISDGANRLPTVLSVKPAFIRSTTLLVEEPTGVRTVTLVDHLHYITYL